MLKFLRASALVLMLSSQAYAADRIGVSMDYLTTNFQTLIANGMQDYAKTKGLDLQVVDAANDVNKQLDQVRNFAAGGVSAIIVDPVDSDGTPAISKIAEDAGIPLIYVNIQPTDLSTLGKKQVFVGSNETESGTLQTKEVCRMLGARAISSSWSATSRARQPASGRRMFTMCSRPPIAAASRWSASRSAIGVASTRRSGIELADVRPFVRCCHRQQ